MDATERIKELLKQRGWSAYKLSKQSGLAVGYYIGSNLRWIRYDDGTVFRRG